MAYCVQPTAAVGPGGGKGGGSRKRVYKAPTDYPKPQQTIQSPDRLYKAPNFRQRPKQINTNRKISNKSSNTY